MAMTYEDLTTEPWAQFNELASRSATFAVYVDAIDRDSLIEGVRAIENSLDSIEKVSIGVPEVGDEAIGGIQAGLDRLDDEGTVAIRVEAQLQGVALSIYITSQYVICIVPAETVADDDPDPTTAPERFKMLVQYGLEVSDLMNAEALYLLDDDDEFRLPEPGYFDDRDIEPIWRRGSTGDESE